MIAYARIAALMAVYQFPSALEPATPKPAPIADRQ